MTYTLSHYKVYSQPQHDSQCVIWIQGQGNFYSDINYDIAVLKFLADKEPLSIDYRYRDYHLIGTYSADQIISIRKLDNDELRKKAIN